MGKASFWVRINFGKRCSSMPPRKGFFADPVCAGSGVNSAYLFPLTLRLPFCGKPVLFPIVVSPSPLFARQGIGFGV
jgi:hypothetical protein